MKRIEGSSEEFESSMVDLFPLKFTKLVPVSRKVKVFEFAR
jgi:hypothetical protein